MHESVMKNSWKCVGKKAVEALLDMMKNKQVKGNTKIIKKNIFLSPGYYINPMVSVDSDVIGGGCVLLPLFLGLHFFPPVALPMEEKCQGK